MQHSFYTSGRGSFAAIGAMLVFLIAGAVGGAIDLSRAMGARQALQDTVDASVMAAASRPGLGADERNAYAARFLGATPFCQANGCTAIPADGSSGTTRLRARIDVPTSLLGLIGMDTLSVGAEAEAMAAASQAVEVAMVLDYSGSMRWSNKYQSMASAASGFLDNAKAQPDGAVSVGIVPFSKYVLAPIDGRYLYDVLGKTDLAGVMAVGCVLNREYPHAVSAATPDGAIDEGSLWPVFSYVTGTAPAGTGYSTEPVQGRYTDYEDMDYVMNGNEYKIRWVDTVPGSGISAPYMTTSGSTYTLNGGGEIAMTFVGAAYVPMQKSGILPWNPTINAFGGYGASAGWSVGFDGGLPSGFSSHKLAEDLSGPCGSYAGNRLWLRPLSTDFDGMKSAIAAMQPIGLTNIALGLDLGWHLLSANQPYTAAGDADAKKIAILLTDGMQTVKAHGPGNVYSVGSANANIAESCTAMKAAGVEMFTIAFGVSDDTTRTLLKTCATGEPNYFEAAQGSELAGIFNTIFAHVASGPPRLLR